MAAATAIASQPDLSTLFDQELRKQQQTNYEQQSTTADSARSRTTRTNRIRSPRFASWRAGRKGLSKQQRDLAKNKDQMSAEEVKRQLERLTRDQEELRRQAEELSKKLQQNAGVAATGQQANRPTGQQGEQSQGGQGSSGSQSSESEKLRQISEEMRNAAGDLRREDPQQASARGAKAGESLRGRRAAACRARGPKNAGARWAICSSRPARSPTRNGAWATKRRAPRRALPAKMRAAGSPPNRSGWPIAPQRLGESVKQLASGSGAEPDEKQAMTEAGRELERQNVAGRMRESAQAMRQGQPGDDNRRPAPPTKSRARSTRWPINSEPHGERDAEASRLSDQLSRAQELRDRLNRLQRSMDELAKAGARRSKVHRVRRARRVSRAQEGKEGSPGQQGSSAGGRDGSVSRLQRDVDDQMSDAQRLAEEMQRENPGMQKGGTTPEQWQRSVSAPGTEAFKQDFAKWESLKKNLLVALEQTESQLSDQLRARENRERLNAGRHDAVADTLSRARRSLLPVPGGAAETESVTPQIARMRFAVVLPWWGYALAFGAALVLGWLAYARVPVQLTAGRRVGLSALRALTLILLIVILLRPVVMVPPAAANNSLLPILVDVSRSMRLRDPRLRSERRWSVATRARAGDGARSAGAARQGIPPRAADVRRSAGGGDRCRSPGRDRAAQRSRAARSPIWPSATATIDSPA